MVNINRALASVKADLAELLDEQAILACCRRLGHRWRNTLLDPAATLHLFIMQILSGNTACWGLRHLSGLSFTASAYCQARQRLPLETIRQLTRQVGRRVSAWGDAAALWRGHRLWLVDGSGISMPDTPELQEHFGQPSNQKEGCGFPVASTLMLMHAGSGAIRNLLVRAMRVHDMSGVVGLHQDLRPGDVLVGDRAFSSYAHLCLLKERGLHGIFRMHQKTIVSFRYRRRYAGQFPKREQAGKPKSQWVRRLGPNDQVVRYFKSTLRPTWMSPQQFDALPPSIEVRELRYQVNQVGFRVKEILLVTTLLDPMEYPAQELAEKFQERWAVEGNFGHLKTTMGAAVLKCKTVEGVTKELWVFALVYNLVRQIMLEAGNRQEVDAHRISFVDALRWVASAQAGQELCELVVNPLREGRFEPRVIKRRMKEYPVMQKPRAILKQEMAAKRVAA
jgi:hypothetical protein